MASLVVRSPSTSANLGSGFDICGLALKAPFDDFEFTKSDTWMAENKGRFHAATHETDSVFAHVWRPMKDKFGLTGSLSIQTRKEIKPKAGMGSSASEASATAYAVNELFSLGLSREELVFFAGQGETFAAGQPHYDNVAPCVLGGFTIAYQHAPLMVKRIEPPDLACLLVVTDREKASTAFARSVLPEVVDRKKALKNSITLSKLLVGFYEKDAETILSALDDLIVEPARASAGILPFLPELKEMASRYGFGAAASGAGPTLIALGKKQDKKFETEVKQLYESNGIKTELLWTEPSSQGVHAF